jgi:hypothetical protein
MRLINTTTGLFEEFIGQNIPKYAILSHTWENEEVSFQDMKDPGHVRKKGYQKIHRTCHMASGAGIKYAWVDTCSINKDSSAELTEAINSMYRWYERAEVCYVFLTDLPASASVENALHTCRWFTRGWTLQELIAPGNVYFFDQEWKYRGSKIDLVEILSAITGIDIGVLRNETDIATLAVAQRMSWAAHRETTRIEDTAYCLLGLFNVNMPLLYGEEEKAFRRLQEEIIKSIADYSIFAWSWPDIGAQHNLVFCGILAQSPLFFRYCQTVKRHATHGRTEFSITNTGIKTQARILNERIPVGGHRYILQLDCIDDTRWPLGIRLRKCGPDQYIREQPWNVLICTRYHQADVVKERYLLSDLPAFRGYHTVVSPQLWDIGTFVKQTRHSVLQVHTPQEMGIWSASPLATFDDEDMLFFVSEDSDSAQTDREFCALRLAANISFELEGQAIEVKFESMFYAIGWSTQSSEGFQCTMVDYQSFSTELVEIQSQMNMYDLHREELHKHLMYHKIPKLSNNIFTIPETTYSIVVSFLPEKIDDPRICQKAFWRIVFSWELCKTENAPKLQIGKWDTVAKLLSPVAIGIDS